MLTPAQAALSGHAQDAVHFALRAAGDYSSTFYGDRHLSRDAVNAGFTSGEKGTVAYSMKMAVHYAERAGLKPSFFWSDSLHNRVSLAVLRGLARRLADEIQATGKAIGWDCYGDRLWDANSI